MATSIRRATAPAKFYTPVPGGVGPLQVLTLVERAVGRTGHLSYLPWSLPMIEGRLAFAG